MNRVKIYVAPDPNETKLEYMKRKADAKFQECKNWFHRNKETVVILAPVLVGGLTTIAKVMGRHSSLKGEEMVKNLYCYDRSLGQYWALRRELSSKAWLDIGARRRAGGRLSHILAGLRVLR